MLVQEGLRLLTIAHEFLASELGADDPRLIQLRALLLDFKADKIGFNWFFVSDRSFCEVCGYEWKGIEHTCPRCGSRLIRFRTIIDEYREKYKLCTSARSEVRFLDKVVRRIARKRL